MMISKKVVIHETEKRPKAAVFSVSRMMMLRGGHLSEMPAPICLENLLNDLS